MTPVKALPALTGVRFIAAAWVVGYHLRTYIPSLCPKLGGLLPLVNQGYVAVPFFFILSGFILSHVYFPTYSIQHHGRFIWLRFARLWPVHLGMIVLLLAYLAVGFYLRHGYVEDSMLPLDALPAELAMVRCWFGHSLLWNLPAWSIQCEWFAYVFLFPVSFYALRRIRRALVMALICCALLAVHERVQLVVPGVGSILALFVAGCALNRLQVLWQAPRQYIMAGGLLTLGLGMISADLTVYCLSFALLILGLSFEDGWLNKLLASRVAVFGGTISYSLYMTHLWPMRMMSELLKRWTPHGQMAGALVLGGTLVAMLLMAAGTQRLIEVPANRWLRR